MGLMIVAAIVAFLFLIAIPVLIVGALIGTVLYLMAEILLFPFRLLGWTLRAGIGVMALVAKLFLLFVLGLAGMALILALALPLFPVTLVAIGVWLLIRPRRSAHVT